VDAGWAVGRRHYSLYIHEVDVGVGSWHMMRRWAERNIQLNVVQNDSESVKISFLLITKLI
jgi:hypothetical protein